jgi:pimeloyl-ACP methyl ester carboxylesterase
MLADQIRRPLGSDEHRVLDQSTRLTACAVGGLRAIAAEMCGLPASLHQVAELTREHPLPAVPLTVISADAPARNHAEQTARTAIRALHETQAMASPLGRLVLASHSGHLVPLDEPELIARCVRETATVRVVGHWPDAILDTNGTALSLQAGGPGP